MRVGMVTLLGRSGGAAISISDESVTDEQISPSSSTAFFELQSDGDTLTSMGAGSDWLIGSTTGSNYECRATLVSGTLSSGTTGSWIALSSDRRWTVTRSSLGIKPCTFTLEIGLAGANIALATAEITITAQVSPA